MDDWFGLQKGLVTVGLLAAVPGCPTSDKDTETGDVTTNPGTTGDTGTGSTGATTGDTPTGSETGGTTGDATTGDATTGDATTGDVEVPPACKSYGAKVAECYMDPQKGIQETAYCGGSHAYYEMTYGAECALAFEAVLACLSALPCEELMGEEPTCEPETAAMDMACEAP